MGKPSRKGDRSFQLGAGKGDKSRITDVAAFRRNYDKINWERQQPVSEIVKKLLKSYCNEQ